MSSMLTKRIVAPQLFKLATLALFILAPCVGCGEKGAGRLPDLIPVKGKVTLKGEPLSSGTVRFEPDDFGRPASGKINSDGTFVLSTHKEGDGVVAGHHRVTISNVDPKSKAAAHLKKYYATTKDKLEADVSAENTEFTFAIP
jgi:hypothetical protein